MKLATSALFILFIILLSSCSTTQVNKNYDAYLNTQKFAIENSKPTFSIKCPKGGCTFTELSYFDPRDKINVKQKNPHPAWAFAGTVVKYGAGIYIAHDVLGFMGDAVNAAGSSYNNSYNTIGGSNTPITMNNDRGVIGDTAPWTGDDNSNQYDNSFNSDDHHISNESPDDTSEGE
jgi:hypothetical protein